MMFYYALCYIESLSYDYEQSYSLKKEQTINRKDKLFPRVPAESGLQVDFAAIVCKAFIPDPCLLICGKYNSWVQVFGPCRY
jgi:hypothetical protein